MENEQKQIWNFQKIEQLNRDEFCQTYEIQLNQVTQNAFLNHVSLEHDGLRMALNQSTHIGLVQQAEQIVGFCFLKVYQERRLNGKILIWINKIAISQNSQGLGYGGKALLADLSSIHRPDEIGFLGCCTQNSGLINFFSGIGIRNFPLTCSYGSAEGVGPWTYINLYIDQVKTRFIEPDRDLDTLLLSNYGILKRGYSKNMNVSTVPLKPEIEKILRDRNFKQEEGDLLVLLTQLN